MALTGFLIDIGARLIVAFIFCVINSLILREIAVIIFKLKDKTMATALHVSIWISVLVLIFSFFSSTILFNVLSVVLIYLLFVFLIKYYYQTEWGKTILIWLVWFIVYIVLGAIIILISGLV